jgi:PadR family transcriptional regulator, regulatory protein PadR
MGRRDIPGTFEQAVLIAIMRLRDGAYGVPLRRELSERLGRDVSYGAIYTTLERMEAKGFVSSREGGATPERGGRSKRYYRVEAMGMKALEDARRAAQTIWTGLPEGAVA